MQHRIQTYVVIPVARQMCSCTIFFNDFNLYFIYNSIEIYKRDILAYNFHIILTESVVKQVNNYS